MAEGHPFSGIRSKENPTSDPGRFSAVSALKEGWIAHKRLVLRTAVLAMSFAAVVWLGYEFYRLLWQPARIGPIQIHPGAVDLEQRHEDLRHLFAGEPIYVVGRTAPYPPASLAMLWLFLGWLELVPAIRLWAATTVAMLGWLVCLSLRGSLADTPLEKLFVALIPLSMYATGATIGNGQLLVHLLPMLVTGLCLFASGPRGWPRDLLAASLVIFSLVKPSVAVPFFWIVLFTPGRIRPALLVCLGYAALTLFAASFQDEGVFVLMEQWLGRATHISSGASQRWSSWDLHVLMGALGLKGLIAPASLLLLGGLGLWAYLHRRVDPWVLIAVTGIVARLWTYHGWYDDLLILLPMIALFRWIKQRPGVDGYSLLAGALLGTTLAVTIAPGGLYLLPAPFKTSYIGLQTLVWIADLAFLLFIARHDRRTMAPAS
jgi:hypothetical protein